jgi:hypothetical protein
MPAPRKFSEDTIRNILNDIHSDMSGEEVAKKYGCSYIPTIRKIWMTEYTVEDIDFRFKRLCALRKLGRQNPMFGKFKDKHHRYKKVHITTQGYRSVEAPRWYLGPTDKNGKALEHIIVACFNARIRKLPEFCIVHHKDENKHNNVASNLEIMNRGKHMVTHRWARHKKKVQRLSRKRVDSK